MLWMTHTMLESIVVCVLLLYGPGLATAQSPAVTAFRQSAESVGLLGTGGGVVPSDEALCSLPPETGPCKALFYRWFFNPATGECEQFVYGGCDGNGNNFETRFDCQAACRTDPCIVTQCPAFPEADCVANFCTGCEADFFVDGELVDCTVTFDCLTEEEACLNPEAMPSTGEVPVAERCCPGLECCACGPPVLPDDFVPPEFGVCSSQCVCPRG